MTPHRRSFREANGKRRHQSAVAVTLLKEPVAFQWLAHDPVKNIDNSGKKSEPRSKRTKSPGPVRRDTKEGLASSVIVPLSGCCQSRCKMAQRHDATSAQFQRGEWQTTPSVGSCRHAAQRTSRVSVVGS